MSKLRRWIGLIVLPTLAATTVVAGQNAPTSQQGTVFRATTNAVQTSVIVRDKDGRFVPDLRQDEFRVYEDGVLQTITTFSPWIGGRSLGNLATGGPMNLGPKIEGLVLPQSRPKNDSSGRFFIVFIDDLHRTPADTPKVKDVMKKVRDILVHDNDLVGFVSTGTSAIEIDPAYDFGHRRFNEAIDKVMGSGPTVDDYIDNALTESAEGPQQVRYNAHVAFRTAFDLLDQMASVTDRRKAFIYISSGYDFNPMSESRLKKIQDWYSQLDPTGANNSTMPEGSTGSDANDPDVLRNEEYKRRTQFSVADLTSEVAELGRAAALANIAFYTVDPRGLLTTGVDASTRSQVSYAEVRDYMEMQTSTLRTLSEMTGGYALVQTNDFEKGLRRIDAETSDFYLVGYTSSNPDPFKVRRQVKIEVTRPGLEAPIYRSEYFLPRPKKK
jgi:VWFA-related protein